MAEVYCRPGGLCGESTGRSVDSAAANGITCAGVTTYKAVKISHNGWQWIAIYGLGGLE